MRIFVLFMLLILITGIAAFVSLNYGHNIGTISLGFKIIPNVTVNVLVLWAFGIGLLWTLILCIVQEIRLRTKISRLKNTIKKLENELGQLRTMPLSDMDIHKEER
ncbi:hypothetical protein DRQ33_00305 [bacterium]|nr:MAG: hypothetical protein DRQ33_00305 [bacterium]